MSETAVDRLRAVARFEKAGQYHRRKGLGKCIGCCKLLQAVEYPVQCIHRTFWQPPRALCQDCFPLWVEINHQWKIIKELMQK